MTPSISKAIPRVDVAAKLRGEARYIADYSFDDLLYAKTVRSNIAKGKILSITCPDIPNGYFIIDKNDVSGVNRMRTVVSDHPVFAENEVNYIGQPILLVLGMDRETVFKICKAIHIDYEASEGIFSMEQSEAQGKVFTEYGFSKGDPEDAFLHSAQIIEDEYRTGLQEHAYLEANGMAAEFKEGQMIIRGSMQCPFYVEGAVSEVLGWNKEKIRIIQTSTGGAFGGKEEFPSLTACQLAVAALKTAHPVMMIYDRDEDIIVSTKRHPSIIRYKAGLDVNHHIIALDLDILYDAGAYTGLSPVVLQRGMFSSTNVYNFEHLHIRGRNLMTNTVPSGAYRGFGAPQTIFGTEMLLHNIAIKLGIEPLEYKMAHFLKRGDPTCTGGTIRDNVKLPEMIEKIVRKSGYGSLRSADSNKIGLGISPFIHGCGFTGNGEQMIQSKILLRKDKDRVNVFISSVEMGQGADTILPKIVAHTLGIPMEKVILSPRDTREIPDSGPTVASRTTMIVGGLMQQAALELKDRWNEAESLDVVRVYHHPSYLQWDNDTFHGDAYPTYSWGVNVAEVAIDTVTLELDIRKIWAIYDVGVAIDERALKGQMQGGIAQGTGWATIEVMEHLNGRLKQKNLTDYKVPTTMDIPDIECEFIENPYEYGPFGAKCAGELPFVGPAPAIAAAVSDALKIPIKQIPITPEYLMEVLNHDH